MILICCGFYTLALMVLVTLNDSIVVAAVESDIVPVTNRFRKFDPLLTVTFDPPNGTFCPTALGVFVRAFYNGIADDTAKIYYELENDVVVNLNSSTTTNKSPYIQLNTPFGSPRERYLNFIAVSKNSSSGYVRSELTRLMFTVEGGNRPLSYGFLIPGIESSGCFVRFGMEVEGVARAQAAGSQEFADFFTPLGIGTYDTQIRALNLSLMANISGFEGGFAVNMSREHGGKHYGILIPYHDGEEFIGKVVRVDLQYMDNITECQNSLRIESMGGDGVATVYTRGVNTSEDSVCVMVLDLASLHINAKGFRRGFVNYPYGYLSAGEFSVVARLDLEHFSIQSARVIDLLQLSPSYGGYSGGFADGTWACFNPFRTYTGPVGGIRSTLAVDAFHLRPYFYSEMLCLNSSAWDYFNNSRGGDSSASSSDLSFVQTLDFSNMEMDLRGFSDALRVGRYAYFTPLNSAEHSYSYKVVRLSLGDVDIGTTLQQLYRSGGSIRSIIDVLDLSKINPSLRGYSGLFTSGQYLFMVPFRNAYEPSNGQRGHGVLTRLNLNDFSATGIDFIDLTTATRNQIPSFADVNLRGFSYGFASGQYGVLVPFYNAVFSGKVARFQTMLPSLGSDIQELDTTVMRHNQSGLFKGYRGGFVSLWRGAKLPDEE